MHASDRLRLGASRYGVIYISLKFEAIYNFWVKVLSSSRNLYRNTAIDQTHPKLSFEVISKNKKTLKINLKTWRTFRN
jgi:hypothetical protein